MKTPKDLDKQSSVYLDEWVDIDSDKWKKLDDNKIFSKKILRLGFEGGTLFTDNLGRVWGNAKDGSFYPLHFEVGEKKYGYRLSKKAMN